MAVILAVEPDRQRGRQLASLVRRSTPAEVIVAQSGSAALAALGTRVPDAILTPASLPAHDEAVLRTWLRRLGDAASHVQTLTVPILPELDAAPRESGSIFGRLLDRGESTAENGSEASEFLEQVMRSLDRATLEGMAAADRSAVSGGVMGEDFEEISLDTLIVEPFADAPAPGPAPSPGGAAAPAADRGAARAWEQELGLDRDAASSPSLWRVSEGLTGEGRAADDAWSRIDPSLPRFRALLARLEKLAAR